jgi:hypothetical protein
MGCDPGGDAEHTGATWVPSIHEVHDPAEVRAFQPQDRFRVTCQGRASGVKTISSTA